MQKPEMLIYRREEASDSQILNDVSSQLTEIASRGTRLALGTQKLALCEVIQANQDALELARSGMSIARSSHQGSSRRIRSKTWLPHSGIAVTSRWSASIEATSICLRTVTKSLKPRPVSS